MSSEKNTLISLAALVSLSCASGCASLNKQDMLPDYKQKTYSVADIAAEYMPRISENHFIKRQDHKAFEHIIRIIDSYKTIHEPEGKEQVVLDRMLAGSWASIYHFELGEIYHGLDKAIDILEDIISDGHVGSSIGQDKLKMLKEDLKTYEITRDYVNSLSRSTGLPVDDPIAVEFDRRMKAERQRWTKDSTYNNIGYADEMSAIDVSVVLRSAELHMINFGNYIDAIRLCDLIKQGNEKSYLYPRTLVLQADAYKQLDRRLKADPSETMDEIEQRGFTDYLIDDIQRRYDTRHQFFGTDDDSLFEQIRILKQPNVNDQGEHNIAKSHVISDILQSRQQANLEYTIDFFGLSPEADLAEAKLQELRSYRQRDQTIRQKTLYR